MARRRAPRAPELCVPGSACFVHATPEATMSRAAVMLHVASQLSGDRPAYPTGREPEAVGDFPVPRVPRTGERFAMRAPRAAGEPETFRDTAPLEMAQWGEELFQNPTPRAAAHLAEAALEDSDELTRVAAAALAFRVSVDPQPALDTLAIGTRSRDELVREVAATALARVYPRHKALDRLRRPGRAKRGGAASHSTTIVHGTWARANKWWQPGGDFHASLVPWRPDLYGAADRFEWTGGYSDAARSLAASELLQWINGHPPGPWRLITHSHGGSVAFLATGNGMTLGQLVVLSCPVHEESMPDFTRVPQVISVRVKWDLVILADGGGQLFDDPRIREIVLPIWFNHSATHYPSVWAKYNVASQIP